jgi:Tfp pilus assembly protein PilV
MSFVSSPFSDMPRNGLSLFRHSRDLGPEAASAPGPRDREAVAHPGGSGTVESRETFSEKARSAARSADGFGLIELLMAMIILNVGILAIVASFNAGVITLNRASRITTASVLGDQQMELYRAIKYDSIRLASATIPSVAPYTTDPAYSASQVVTPACPGPSYPNECNASRVATGADGKPYRVDTYIVEMTPGQGQPNQGRPVKQVTVVVRDAADVNKVFARQASSFDQSTG